MMTVGWQGTYKEAAPDGAKNVFFRFPFYKQDAPTVLRGDDVKRRYLQTGRADGAEGRQEKRIISAPSGVTYL